MAETDHGARSRRLRLAALLAVWVVVLAGAWFVVHRDDGQGTGVVAGSNGATDAGSDPGTDASAGASTTLATTTTAPTTTLPVTTTTTPTGRFVTAPGNGPVNGTGTVHRYRAEVEEGSGVDPVAFAAIVDGILADPRGWVTTDGVAFQRVSDGTESFTITLATAATTDQICLPLRTNGRYSCHEGSRVVLNLLRWNEGTAELPFGPDDYRAHVVNHEVGHELGHGHVGCGGAGLHAPVMMQQSKGLAGCLANVWPTLDGT